MSALLRGLMQKRSYIQSQPELHSVSKKYQSPKKKDDSGMSPGHMNPRKQSSCHQMLFQIIHFNHRLHVGDTSGRFLLSVVLHTGTNCLPNSALGFHSAHRTTLSPECSRGKAKVTFTFQCNSHNQEGFHSKFLSDRRGNPGMYSSR